MQWLQPTQSDTDQWSRKQFSIVGGGGGGGGGSCTISHAITYLIIHLYIHSINSIVLHKTFQKSFSSVIPGLSMNSWATSVRL